MLSRQVSPPAVHVWGHRGSSWSLYFSKELILFWDTPMQTSPVLKSKQMELWNPLQRPLYPISQQSQCKNSFTTNINLCNRRHVVFSAQVTTAIIFNVEVFNEALRRVLTARRTAWSAVTVPVPEHNVKPQNPKCFFFLIQYVYHSHCTDDFAWFSLSSSWMESQWDPSAV